MLVSPNYSKPSWLKVFTFGDQLGIYIHLLQIKLYRIYVDFFDLYILNKS